MFLEYGLNQHDELVHIDHSGRGRVSLYCPYCGMRLVARKGQKLAHHFAHDGETCREVATRDNVQLPAYDSFGLSLSSYNWQLLQDFHLRGFTPYGSKERLEQLGLIQYNRFGGPRGMGEYQTTYKGKIPFGETTLQKFADIQRGLLIKRHDKLVGILKRATTAANQRIALADLQLYRAQLQRVLSCALYFLEIKHSGGVLYKIGVTSRTIDERVSEIGRDLTPHFEKVKIKVLRLLNNQGSVEHYFKHRYAAAATAVGNLTEYFTFEQRRNVLSDLTRLGDRELTEFETAVLAGQLPSAAATIKDELAKLRLSEQIKEGMATAVAEGKHVGRPAESAAEIVDKYPAVVQAIKDGLSRKQAATAAGVSVPTVRKVHEAMKATQPRNETDL